MSLGLSFFFCWIGIIVPILQHFSEDYMSDMKKFILGNKNAFVELEIYS